MSEKKFIPPISKAEMKALKAEGKFFPPLDTMSMLHLSRGFYLDDEELAYYEQTKQAHILKNKDLYVPF